MNERLLFANRNQTFSIHTLGCKANNYDSECIKTSFIASNFIEQDFSTKNVGVVIINTCAVTNKSESKSRKYINLARRLTPNGIVAVVGCYSQIKSDEIKSKMDVDIVSGTENKDKLVNIIEQNQVIEISPITNIEKHEKNISLKKYFQNTRAFIKIQDGCNNFCTFCIIPYTRGRLRSRKPEYIINELNDLVTNGHKEIVLTGIHTAGYGEDLPNYSFGNLLSDILEKVHGLKRLRISSIEASQVSSKIINILKSSNILVPHLHIPLQSGSNQLLEKMERLYNIKQYRDVVNNIKHEIPNIAITTDIIIGFPTETQQNFEEAYNFCKEIGFSELHVFPYAKKTNTPAASMTQVNDFVKKIRVSQMLELNKELALNYIKANTNRVLKVLFENKKDDDYYIGYSENYIKIKCKSSTCITNKILTVKIIESNYPVSIGEIIYEKN